MKQNKDQKVQIINIWWHQKIWQVMENHF